MCITTPLPFVHAFVDERHEALDTYQPGAGRSRRQRLGLSCCLMGMLVTNAVCWAKFARASLGPYALAALSWMFRQSRMPWALLRQMRVRVLLATDGITPGSLGLDDSDHRRSPVTTRLFNAPQLNDQTSGGSLHGQNLVFWRLVTPSLTIPVGVAFDLPDPVLTAWRHADKPLTQPGVPAHRRPPHPARHPQYPTTPAIALHRREAFAGDHPSLEVKMVRADAWSATPPCMDRARRLFGTQVISQWRHHQHVRLRGQRSSIAPYVTQSPGVPHVIKIRGEKDVPVRVSRARRSVDAHHTKRLVMALTDEGESDDRSWVASDLSWRTVDIVQGDTLRWLVEGFLEDWKSYEGWGPLTTQPDEEGSSRRLILSVLRDHGRLCHPYQQARLEHKRPACTVGSLHARVRVDRFLACIRELLLADNPHAQLNRLTQALEEVFPLAPSQKQMNTRDLGRQEPTPTLQYRAEVAYASR